MPITRNSASLRSKNASASSGDHSKASNASITKTGDVQRPPKLGNINTASSSQAKGSGQQQSLQPTPVSKNQQLPPAPEPVRQQSPLLEHQINQSIELTNEFESLANLDQSEILPVTPVAGTEPASSEAFDQFSSAPLPITSHFRHELDTNRSFQFLPPNQLKYISNLLDEIENIHHQRIEEIHSNYQATEQSLISNNLENLAKEIQTLKTSIMPTNLHSATSATPSYATALKHNLPKTTIVIKPPEGIDSSEMLETLHSLPCPDHVSITKVRKQRNVVEVRCASEHQKHDLKEHLSTLLDPQTSVQDKQPLRSKIIIFHVPDEVHPEQLPTLLNIPIDTDIQIIRKLRTDKESHMHWVLLLPKALANHLTSQGHLFIGFRRHYLKAYNPIKRCYKCLELGSHHTAICPNSIRCSNCSEPHPSTTCTNSVPACSVCLDFNSSLSKDPSKATIARRPTNHAASDPGCPSFLDYKKSLFTTSKPSSVKPVVE